MNGNYDARLKELKLKYTQELERVDGLVTKAENNLKKTTRLKTDIESVLRNIDEIIEVRAENVRLKDAIAALKAEKAQLRARADELNSR